MTGVQSFALPIFGLDGIFAACVARKNPLYTNMLIIDRQSSGSERVTRETAKALTRKNLDMDFCGAAIINDPADGERYEIGRASCRGLGGQGGAFSGCAGPLKKKMMYGNVG